MPRDPTGDVVRNLVTLRRISNGLAADMREAVRALIDDLVAELARTDPTAVTRDRYRKARVEKIVARLREVAGPHTTEMRRTLESALARLGKQQASWAASTLEAAVGDVAAVDVRLEGIGLDRFRTIMRSRPFQGRLMREWFSTYERRTLDLVRQQVRLGMAQNEPIGDLVRRIRGRSVGGGRFSGGVLDISTRDAEAIARTSVNFISNEGHLEAYRANSDVVTRVEFTATLDSRTTPICARWDGTTWGVDDPGKQAPPLHVNCRSVLTPVVDWQGLGIEPPAEGTRAAQRASGGPQAGQVKASVTYEDWFRRQPKGVQNEIIGPRRAEMFREGKLTFRDMIGKDNRVLSLEELEAAA